jgi:hypothetical protein
MSSPLPTDTGWKPIIVDGGDGSNSAAGHIEMATGREFRPCIMCKSFEKDENRLVQHLIARGLKPQADGSFISPIAVDMRDGDPMRIYPKKSGYCRREGSVPEDTATCEKWAPVLLVDDLRRRIKRR